MSSHPKLRLGILGSGKGTNFQAIAEAIKAGALAAEVCVVISDVENAGILEAARARKIPAHFVPPGRFRTKLEPEAEERVVELLREAGVELVVLAGWMRMIKGVLLEAFPEKSSIFIPRCCRRIPGWRLGNKRSPRARRRPDARSTTWMKEWIPVKSSRKRWSRFFPAIRQRSSMPASKWPSTSYIPPSSHGSPRRPKAEGAASRWIVCGQDARARFMTPRINSVLPSV